MSFCLCHLSIKCYTMGDLHSAATNIAKVSAFEKRRKKTDATFLWLITVL